MALGTTEFIDSTTANVWIPEIWSAEAIVARPQRTVFGSLVGHQFQKELKFGDIVNIGTVGNLTAQTKAKSSNTALSFETITELNTQLTVATWEYSGIAVETIVTKQAMINLAAKYAPKQGYALDLAVDDVLAGLVDDTTNSVGTLGATLGYDEILQANQYLDDANVPEENRVIIASPAQVAEWMKLDVFIRSDYSAVHGTVGAPAGNAYIRSWLGMPVYKTTNVEGDNASGHDNCMMHRDGLQLVMQISPRAHKDFDINYLCDKIVLEQLYGTKIMPIASSVTTYEDVIWMKGL